jgi:hypothetical protein
VRVLEHAFAVYVGFMCARVRILCVVGLRHAQTTRTTDLWRLSRPHSTARGGAFETTTTTTTTTMTRVTVALAVVMCAMAGADVAHARAVPRATALTLEPRDRVEVGTLASTHSLVEAFEAWMVRHGKTYADDAHEYAARMEIFAKNAAFVVEHNAKYALGEVSHWVGLNAFAASTREEFKQLLGYDASSRALKARQDGDYKNAWRYANVDVPEEIDWVERGAVTKVKNQGRCGSCWAFSTSGAVEGLNQIKTGRLVSLSEQEMVSCSRENSGCNGGLMDNAFKWIIENGGIDSERQYPYVALAEECEETKLRLHMATIDGFEDVPAGDEDALEKAVAMQPVSVAIEADHQSFQLYEGGVYDAHDCGADIDHGVLVVGYGIDHNTTHPKHHRHYWKIKNSWGQWGENGYIRIARRVKRENGQCGITTAASYPTKK